MATQMRPGMTYSTSDWFSTNHNISSLAEQQRNQSHDVRQDARSLRNITGNKTKWDQHDNNTRLADRIDNIREWKTILEGTLEELNNEITQLSDSKARLEHCLESKNLPAEVSVDSLVTRDNRKSIDVVKDEADDMLNKEQELVESIKRKLQARIGATFEQLCSLQECRQQVQADLQDKHEALGIDIDQYNLTEDSPNISYKPDPCRIPKGSLTPQQWLDFSRRNKERADAEMANSRRMRELNEQTMSECENALQAHAAATDFLLRKRMHELQRALDDLNWQKKQTEDEMGKIEEEIRRLEAAIWAKRNPQKLAETRLENRTTRPGAELCRDNVQYGLTDEVRQIETSKMALEESLKKCQHALHNLELRLHHINEQIAIKSNSLRLDDQVLKSRAKLGTVSGTTCGTTTCSGVDQCERNMANLGVNSTTGGRLTKLIAY